MRVATTSDSFEVGLSALVTKDSADRAVIQLSTEEVTAIQDRIIATTLPAGDSRSPIKVQGKEYSIQSVTDDVLVAKSGVSDRLRLQSMPGFWLKS